MIQHLKGTATFKMSGATILVDFQPASGITAVVGHNGSGKTFTASEFPRWLLFGSRALRGTLSTYSKLEGVGTFTIRGRSYTISRTPTETKITDGLAALAVGAEEVNRKVVELLGYPLEVFDLCNSVVQGRVNELGDLTPAKRKAMIDDVLRLTDVSVVEKACRDEANALRREAVALTGIRNAPGNAPIEPQNFISPDDLRQLIAKAREVERLERDLGILVPPLDEPKEPTLDVEDLTRRVERQRRREALAEAAAAPAASMTMEQIEIALARYRWEQAQQPAPTTSRPICEASIFTWDQIDAIEKMASQPVECPECHHNFDLKPESPLPPEHTKSYYVEQLRLHDLAREPEPSAAEGAISPSVAEELRKSVIAAQAGELARAELKMLGPAEPSVYDLFRSNADLLKRYERWQQYLRDAEEQDEKDRKARDAIAALGPVDTLEELIERLARAERYLAERSAYEERVKSFCELGERITDLTARADDFKEGAKTLAEGRAELKSFLAPALSREATELIFDMTNGKLKFVVVDDDMEITVDGQPLETLSGAGKTVANLALRLAFAKVLVADAFPVFVADEIDGDLDAERREATIEAIKSLKKHFQQIILITHRDVSVADHVKELP
jgi:DNA repair exonuclease SbcCD ATPase subunit